MEKSLDGILTKTHSNEQKQALTEINTGKQWTDETREKLSNTLKDQYTSGKRIPWNKVKKWSKGVVNG